ncbi:MAG TPA: 4-hydroxy-tetrahydrodipicolinate reductase [Caulobacteraceae bacterium]|nr:4-hydroxy-tetrahydrodipicolinate reductase [Caulobacteraceae bacterium]
MAQGEIRIGVAGALGRMGQALAAQVAAHPGLVLAALFDRPDTVGAALGDRVLVGRGEALALCDVIIDFTSGPASAALAQACAAQAETNGRAPALVVGTTGLTDEEAEAVRAAAGRVPVVKSGNFSLGVNVLLGLVAQAAQALKARDFDIEVFEAHHRRKVDAPSGTALMLGEAAAMARGGDLKTLAVRARDGLTGPRDEGTIGFSVARGGGVVGEHSVIFAGEDEVLTLSHSARDRRLFARGAVEAAAWVAGRPPGLYDMQDVLGMRG